LLSLEGKILSSRYVSGADLIGCPDKVILFLGNMLAGLEGSCSGSLVGDVSNVPLMYSRLKVSGRSGLQLLWPTSQKLADVELYRLLR
jgi:hypothetical protein